MALKMRYQGNPPIGDRDALDTEASTWKGGEVGGITYVSTTGTDKYASDSSDGYVDLTAPMRPVVTTTLVSGMRPLGLIDEGTTGYGTLLGQLVGGSVGQQSTGGPSFGPHTTSGSGKVTFWTQPGEYAVTLDAVDQRPDTGLQPTNTTLSTSSPTPLYANSFGLLTPNSAAAFELVPVGHFIEFRRTPGYVVTPKSLVSALNSPTGSSGAQPSFDEVVFYFLPPTTI
jgi:hypothetical protein